MRLHRNYVVLTDIYILGLSLRFYHLHAVIHMIIPLTLMHAKEGDCDNKLHQMIEFKVVPELSNIRLDQREFNGIQKFFRHIIAMILRYVCT